MANVMASRITFSLPRLRPSGPVRHLFSFRREELVTFGAYIPGLPPLLFHNAPGVPDETPFATMVHEQVHRELTGNTSAGLFHQALEIMLKSSRDMVSLYLASAAEQWSVHELDALYTELVYIATRQPHLLDQTVARLPSNILDEPPYREVFDSITRYLPIQASDTRERRLAKHVLVHLIVAWSMSNDCLHQFRNLRNATVDKFLTYLVEQSPHVRFEWMMSELLSTGELWKILDKLTEELASPNCADPITWLIPQLCSIRGEVPNIDIVVLKAQFRSLTNNWEEHGHFSTKPEPPPAGYADVEGAPPIILAAPTYFDHYEREFRARSTLTVASLRDQLTSPQRSDIGMLFGLGLRKDHAYFQFGTYLREGDGPVPISGPAREDFREVNLLGVLPLDEVGRLLSDLPLPPHILVLRGVNAWAWWSRRGPDSREPKNRVLACSEGLELSVPMVQELLKVRGIGQNPRFAVMSIKGTEIRWAFFINPSDAGSYSMVNVSNDARMHVFERIVSMLELTQLEEHHVAPRKNIMGLLALFSTGFPPGTDSVRATGKV